MKKEKLTNDLDSLFMTQVTGEVKGINDSKHTILLCTPETKPVCNVVDNKTNKKVLQVFSAKPQGQSVYYFITPEAVNVRKTLIAIKNQYGTTKKLQKQFSINYTDSLK